MPNTWEARVVAYSTYLIDQGIQSSTIKSYISAIKAVLINDGYNWCQNTLLLNTLTQSCKLINDQVRHRMPIKSGLLHVLLCDMADYFDIRAQSYLKVMYTSLFLVGFYGMFRIGELTTGNHPILAKDIHLGNNKRKMLIVLHTSKTHGIESLPQKVKIEGNITLAGDIRFNPYIITQSYLSLRGDYSDINDPLYIFRDGRPVQPIHVRKLLKKLLINSRLNPQLYDTHSLRIGRATELQKLGTSIETIKRVGRWRSNAVYKYLKT